MPSDKCINSILKSKIMDSVIAWARAKEQVELGRKLKVGNVKQTEKLLGMKAFECVGF